MLDLRAFRDDNSLIQKDLADYLSVSVAFISAVEKGQSKLPGEKLAKLLSNDRGWNTDSLVKEEPNMRPYYDFKTMSGGQDFGGAQIQQVSYSGMTEEQVQQIVKFNLAEYESENRALKIKVQDLSQENAFLKTIIQQMICKLGADIQLPEMAALGNHSCDSHPRNSSKKSQ